METVVERLKLNDKSLQILDLRDETLGGTQGDDDKKEPNGISFLCNALRDSYYLIQLNLSGNNLNDEDCMHIGSALLTNEGLTVLNLSYNKIGCKGAKEIAAALKLHSLAVLNIGYNVIKESGGSEVSARTKPREERTTTTRSEATRLRRRHEDNEEGGSSKTPLILKRRDYETT